MATLVSTALVPPKVLLVGLSTLEQSNERTVLYLAELAELAHTLGVTVMGQMIQHRAAPHPKTFLGKGKLEELAAWVAADQIDQVMVDDELSPAQVRNLERTLRCRVLDRNFVILEIFALRAQTSQAKLQVELAQSEYLLPRLTRLWTHLSRQRGGTGTRGGAGEKEIETDRRNIRHRITTLRRRLEEVGRQVATQRKQRGSLPQVALVGYTNVGKSTLMQRLSGAPVLVEDALFATITSTVRKVKVRDLNYFLADTVGFIRKLPHTLVACFQATLEEVRQADLLLHVVDGSNPDMEAQIEVVQATLQDIQAGDIPTLLVVNKIDQCTTPPPLSVWASRYNCPVVGISATQGEGITRLQNQIHHLLTHGRGGKPHLGAVEVK